MSTLAPETQMFMQGCPPELDAKYQRIQARGIVVRNLFALSAGVQKTIYWYLPADPIEGDARFNVMTLMYGKIGLVAHTSQGFGEPASRRRSVSAHGGGTRRRRARHARRDRRSAVSRCSSASIAGRRRRLGRLGTPRRLRRRRRTRAPPWISQPASRPRTPPTRSARPSHSNRTRAMWALSLTDTPVFLQ